MFELYPGDRAMIIVCEDANYFHQIGTVMDSPNTHPDYVVLRMDKPLECIPGIGPKDEVEFIALPESFMKLDERRNQDDL